MVSETDRCSVEVATVVTSPGARCRIAKGSNFSMLGTDARGSELRVIPTKEVAQIGDR
jgi:hypothetical protein